VLFIAGIRSGATDSHGDTPRKHHRLGLPMVGRPSRK